MFKLLLKVRNFIWNGFVQWLTRDRVSDRIPLSDFDRLRYELRPGDVILVEGQSKVSDIIKMITQSIWTHSFLYIGRLHDIDDPNLRNHIKKFHSGGNEDQIVIESLLGQGTIANPLEKYRKEHLRICRPRGLTRSDSQKVIYYAIMQLGTDYNVRQLLDLARFMFPYGILPRRWRSSLFEHNAGRPTKSVCSSMLAEAFAGVHFPIRQMLHQNESGELKLYRRNSQLIIPADFDYSPYFDVIKYPMLDFDELALYKRLPWDRSGVNCSDTSDWIITDSEAIDLLAPVATGSKKITIDDLDDSLDFTSIKNTA
ncbi:MAG: YiiX/YebB-like N1pC/P60 family cysteine hydrolase [Gammaproteobacteria bacterium]|nr:YiiX/YebB-like N1pC/P60 family cysteine hydrolase [Gammaproteobacteria bacterium]